MLLPLLLATALHAASPADSITGTWKITGDVVGNAVDETCMLKQTGAKISGTCAFTDAGAKPYEVTGEVKGDTITFTHGGEYQGQELTLTYSATFTSTKDLKGAIDVKPFGATGSFTATRTASSTPAKP